jgi:hypothetical protein
MDEYDLTAEGSALARRKQLVDAMLKQSQEADARVSTQENGGVLTVLGDILRKRKAEGMSKQLDTDTSQYQQKYGDQLAHEMRGYFDTANGAPGVPMGPPTENDEMSQPGPTKGNPREAVLRALSSRLPEMQKLGQGDMTLLRKQSLDPLELLKLSDFDPKSRVTAAQSGDISSLQGKGTEHVINNQLVKSGPDGAKPVGDFRDTYGGTKNVNGEAVQFETSTNKAHQVANRPAGGVSVLVPGQKAGYEKWSELAAKTVGDLAEKARSSNNMLTQLNQIEALSNSGTMNGPTANPAIWLGQLFSAGGIPMDAKTQAKLSNSQTFENTAADLWLSSMNANGGSRGLVKEESERIARSLPSLVQTPQGRQQIVNVMRQAAQQSIVDAQKASKEYAEALNTQDASRFTFGLSATQLPSTAPRAPAPGSVAPTGKPLSFDDYFEKLGVK